MIVNMKPQFGMSFTDDSSHHLR